MKHFSTVDEYLDSFNGVTKERLEEMRKIVKSQLPKAKERISYNIPAYFLNNKLIIYFAGFNDHISMYPGRTNSSAYNNLAKKYASGKSTARFLHTEKLPKQIIDEFIAVRLKELELA
jgi:uncharacterized protein YdhG (YjbR/CyaY superfamily)